jgi:tetratricopeptide (TPR) repeat protein
MKKNTILRLLAIVAFCSCFLFSFAQKTYTEAEKDSIWASFSKKISPHSMYSVKYQHYMDSFLTIANNKAYLWQQKGMPCFKSGKYELGMTYLDKAVEIVPKKYINYRAFIKCIFTKQQTSAIADFKTGQKLLGEQYEMDHPNNFWISVCYLQLNQLDSAKIYMERCNKWEQELKGEDKDHRLNAFYLGIIEYEYGNYERAIQYFDKALAWYSNFSDAKYYKAQCCEKLGRNEERISLLTSALADIKQGYSIVEDNTIYENYPYQIKKSWLEMTLKNLKEKE